MNLNSEEVLREVVRLGYDSAPGVQKRLPTGDYGVRSRDVATIINAALGAEGKQAQALNPETADALLALLPVEHSADMYALHYNEIERGQCVGVASIVEFVLSHGLQLGG